MRALARVVGIGARYTANENTFEVSDRGNVNVSSHTIRSPLACFAVVRCKQSATVNSQKVVVQSDFGRFVTAWITTERRFGLVSST